MSVFIRGFNLPTEPMILILFPNGDISTEDYFIGANAKAIELPAQHGRLIDGDVAEVITADHEDGDFIDGILYAAEWIANQPTIIEAEGE